VSKTPYPGYPPNYTRVDETGGFTRTCIVIESLSLGPLDNTQKALIQEQLEALMDKLSRQVPIIERTDVVFPDRFDPILRKGLRLS
jgi:hypothetical protein